MSTKPETKPWYLSKTIWLGVLTALAAAGEYATGALSGLMSGDQMTLLVAAVGVLGTVLRLFTGQPVAVKKARPDDSGHVRLPLLAGSALLAVALSVMVGCAFLKSIPWDKVISAGGVLVDAAGKATTYTCGKMEQEGAPAKAIADCYKAESIIKEKIGPAYGIGAGIVGTFATTAPLDVPGVGPVKVMAISPNMKPLDLGKPGKGCIGFRCPTTAEGGVKIEDSAPVQ